MRSRTTARRLVTIGTRAALTAVLALAVFAFGRPAAGHAATGPLTVVAVGDSYASGEGAIGGGWVNSACHRSALAGPQDAATQLSALRSTSFTSFACSGSTTASLLGGGGQLSMLPSGRIDALTMSIGGNDIGFAGIVMSCMTSDCTALDSTVTASLGPLSSSLATVFASVPNNVTNVFVTEYPDPTTGVFGALCGTPASPAFQGFDGITPTEALWASTRVVARLNATLASAVAAANARPGPHPVFHFVTGITSRFSSHGYCTGGGSPAFWAWPNPRFISTPVDSLTSQGDVFGTMHPNDLGQKAIGAALFGAMDFLAKSLNVNVTPSATPIVGAPVGLTIDVATAAGTPVPGAPVVIDGASAGTTDQTGRLVVTRTFATAGTHTVSVDQNPFPAAAGGVAVYGKAYTVTSSPDPIPVGTAISLWLQATDAASQIVGGTFTLTSGTGTVSIRSDATATVTLTMRNTYQYELNDLGKPVKVLVQICPKLTFQPDSSAFDPSDVSYLVDC